MLKYLITAAMFICGTIGLTGTAVAEKRVALVVGNSEYGSNGVLKNPEVDAKAVSRKLSSLGFRVIEGYNLDYDEMRETVREFARETRDADLTVFYYAGHGIAVDNVNYMIPIDARMDDAVDWEFEVYALPDVLKLINRSNGASLVFLDACRNNPMAEKLALARGMSTRSLSTRGLSPVAFKTLGTSGSVIAYATEPGQVALDGEGDNSPFTTALLRHIGTANADFASLTSLITRDVLEMTEGQQRPRFDVSLTGPLVLNRVDTPTVTSQTEAVSPPVPVASGASLEIEKIIFETARTSGDAADYQAYIDAFPNGAFAVLARNAMQRLQGVTDSSSGDTQVASLDTGNQEGLSETTRSYRGTDPLILTITPAARAGASSKATENLLALSKTQRKETQLRLTLSGNNVGRPDGVIGNGTRRGISSWQAMVGYAPTGYLNAVQHQTLVANTQVAFVQHMAANPNALVHRSSGKRRKKSNNNGLGAFLGGLAVGALISR